MAKDKKKKTDDLTRGEFKDRVAKYFEFVKETNERRKVEGGFALPISPPGLAQHLLWTTEKLMTYPAEGKFRDLIDIAMLQCENFILEAMFSKRIDKATGNMMLATYFGYSDKGEKKKAIEKAKRSISQILNEIEAE